MGSLSGLRDQETLASLLPSGEVLVVDGTTAEVYAPLLGRSTVELSLNAQVDTLVMLRSGDVLLLDDDQQATLYDNETRALTPIGSLGGDHAFRTATLLDDGRVLIIGSNPTPYAEVFEPATNSLVEVTASSVQRFNPTATLLKSGEVLVAGGGGDSNGSVELFDPGGNAGSGSWRTHPTSLPQLTQQAAVRLRDGRVYLFNTCSAMACDLGSITPVVVYDPGTDSIYDASQTTELAFDPRAARLPSGLTLLTAGYELGLFGPDTGRAETHLVAPNDDGSGGDAGPSLQLPRVRGAMVVLPGGEAALVGGANLPSVEAFDLGPGSLSAGPNLATARFGARGVVFSSGRALVAGGYQRTGFSGAVLSSTEIYDSASDQWLPGPDLDEARDGMRVTLIDADSALISGGAGTKTLLYRDSTGAFEAGPDMATARRLQSVVRLPDGRLWVTGGVGGAMDMELSSTELYDPVSNTFSPGPELTKARAAHQTVLLTDGRVLIAGRGAEVFDPVTGVVTATGSPIADRREAATVLLPDGRVLFGGAPKFGITFAEVYDPALGAFRAQSGLAEGGTRSGVLGFDGRAVLSAGEIFVGEGVARTAHAVFGPLSKRFLEFGPSAGLAERVALRLPDHRVLFPGGRTSLDPLGSNDTEQLAKVTTELWVSPHATPESERPSVTVPVQVQAGAEVTITGERLLGAGPNHASRSRGGMSSAFPVALWSPASGQGLVVGTLKDWTDSRATWEVPVTALAGPGWFAVSVAGELSVAVPVTIERAPLGTPCSNPVECDSGLCAQGVCCDQPCNDFCEACTAALKGSGVDGECGTVPFDRDLGDKCVRSAGSQCSNADECDDGFCVDGVCCDSQCGGQCEACNLDFSGRCLPVTGAPIGDRPSCDAPAGDPCAARVCDGVDRTQCAGFVGPEVQCQSASCADGVAQRAATCDGAGSCPVGQPEPCAPFACAADACGTSCGDNDDCADGFRCESGDCVPRDFECDGLSTVVAPDGTEKACDPYRCDDTGCLTECQSTADCVKGFVCSAGSECVPLNTGGGGDGGGCGCGVPAREPSAPWLLLLPLLGWARRKRA